MREKCVLDFLQLSPLLRLLFFFHKDLIHKQALIVRSYVDLPLSTRRPNMTRAEIEVALFFATFVSE